MASRLTDKQKKDIIADYVETGSYNATAKRFGVALNTVKKICTQNADIAQKCKQKKEQNTADMLAYMTSDIPTASLHPYMEYSYQSATHFPAFLPQASLSESSDGH